MEDSILQSIKKLLGISKEDTSFDTDIIIDINSEFMTLNQLGIGPKDGFFIENGDATWDKYIPDKIIAEPIKTYVYIKVKIVFDPPASPTVLEALQSTADEKEWRIARWAEDHPIK